LSECETDKRGSKITDENDQRQLENKMSWNGSNITAHTGRPQTPKRSGGRLLYGVIVGILVAIFGMVVAWWFMGSEREIAQNPADKIKKIGTAKTLQENTKRDLIKNNAGKQTKQSKAAKIASEYNDQVKSLIKAKTNDIVWIVKPLDPNDPDNALRTRVTQELGSLLSTEPGEPMPPFPYSFLLEDDMREAAERGEDVGEIDNGNAAFLESLKKFKIVAKDTDDEHRLEHKAKLIEAQGELLSGLDRGLSVNDSIRAAYEFRKRAYETRNAAIETMSEFI